MKRVTLNGRTYVLFRRVTVLTAQDPDPLRSGLWPKHVDTGNYELVDVETGELTVVSAKTLTNVPITEHYRPTVPGCVPFAERQSGWLRDHRARRAKLLEEIRTRKRSTRKLDKSNANSDGTSSTPRKSRSSSKLQAAATSKLANITDPNVRAQLEAVMGMSARKKKSS